MLFFASRYSQHLEGALWREELLPKEDSTVAFRLHRFMLSHHSPVFKDTFTLPINMQMNKMYEGVPVVRCLTAMSISPP